MICYIRVVLGNLPGAQNPGKMHRKTSFQYILVILVTHSTKIAMNRYIKRCILNGLLTAAGGHTEAKPGSSQQSHTEQLH